MVSTNGGTRAFVHVAYRRNYFVAVAVVPLQRRLGRRPMLLAIADASFHAKQVQLFFLRRLTFE